MTTAQILSVAPTKNTRIVKVLCPFCGRPHIHGWPYGDDEPGHRVAHCSPASGGSYTITGSEAK